MAAALNETIPGPIATRLRISITASRAYCQQCIRLQSTQAPAMKITHNFAESIHHIIPHTPPHAYQHPPYLQQHFPPFSPGRPLSSALAPLVQEHRVGFENYLGLRSDMHFLGLPVTRNLVVAYSGSCIPWGISERGLTASVARTIVQSGDGMSYRLDRSNR